MEDTDRELDADEIQEQKRKALDEYALKELELLEETPFGKSMREDELGAYGMLTQDGDGTWSPRDVSWKKVFAAFFLNSLLLVVWLESKYAVLLFDFEMSIQEWFYWMPEHYCALRGDWLASSFTFASFLYFVLQIWFEFVVFPFGSLHIDKIVTVKFTHKQLFTYVASRWYIYFFMYSIIYPLMACRIPDGQAVLEKTKDWEKPFYPGKPNYGPLCTLSPILFIVHIYSVFSWQFIDVYFYWKAANGVIESKLLYGIPLVAWFGAEIYLILENHYLMRMWECKNLHGFLRYYEKTPEGHDRCLPFWVWYTDATRASFQNMINKGIYNFPAEGPGSYANLYRRRQYCPNAFYNSSDFTEWWLGDCTLVSTYTYVWGHAHPTTIAPEYDDIGLCVPWYWIGMTNVFFNNFVHIWVPGFWLAFACGLLIVMTMIRGYKHGSRGQFGDIVIYEEDSPLVQRPREFCHYMCWLKYWGLSAAVLGRFDHTYIRALSALVSGAGDTSMSLIWLLIFFFLVKLGMVFCTRTGLGRNQYLPLVLSVQFMEATAYQILVYMAAVPFSYNWGQNLMLLLSFFIIRDALLQQFTRLVFIKLGWMDDGVLEDLIFDEEASQFDTQTSLCNMLACTFPILTSFVEMILGDSGIFVHACYVTPNNACVHPAAMRFLATLVSSILFNIVGYGVIMFNRKRMERTKRDFVANNHHKKLDSQLVVSWEKPHDWMPRSIFFKDIRSYGHHHFMRSAWAIALFAGVCWPLFEYHFVAGTASSPVEKMEYFLQTWRAMYLRYDFHMLMREL